MSSHSPQPASARRRFFPFLAAISPLRYGVVAIIVVTVGYSFLRVVPMLRHDVELLRDTYAVDEQGIRLEGDLMYQVQESRREFLRVLLAAGKPAEVEEETRSMRGSDAAVALTENRIAQLGAISSENRQQFHASWRHYIAVRDKILAATLTSDPEQVRRIDSDLGSGAFVPVE